MCGILVLVDTQFGPEKIVSSSNLETPWGIWCKRVRAFVCMCANVCVRVLVRVYMCVRVRVLVR